MSVLCYEYDMPRYRHSVQGETVIDKSWPGKEDHQVVPHRKPQIYVKSVKIYVQFGKASKICLKFTVWWFVS